MTATFASRAASAQAATGRPFPRCEPGLLRYAATFETASGERRSEDVLLRFTEAAGSSAASRQMVVDLLTLEGAPHARGEARAPDGAFPFAFFVDRRGLALERRGRPVVPLRVDRLPLESARRPAGRVYAYRNARGFGCLASGHAGAGSRDARALRVCVDHDGAVREYRFESGESSVTVTGPVTRARDVVGEWLLAPDAATREGRTFALSIDVDARGRVFGRYAVSGPDSVACTVAEREGATTEDVAVDVACLDARAGAGESRGPTFGSCLLRRVGPLLVLATAEDDRSCVPAEPPAGLAARGGQHESFVAPLPSPARAVVTPATAPVAPDRPATHAPVIRVEGAATVLDAGSSRIRCETFRDRGLDGLRCALTGTATEGIVVNSSFAAPGQFLCARAPVEVHFEADGGFDLPALLLQRPFETGLRMRLAPDVVAWIDPFLVSVELHTPDGAAHLDLPSGLEIGEAFTMETSFSGELLAGAIEAADLTRPPDYREFAGRRVSPCFMPY